MTSPTSDTPPPVHAAATPPPTEPTPAEPPIVEINADPMMMQVIQGSGGPSAVTFARSDDDH